MAFTKPTYDVDNIQNLADQPTESATILKQTFDKTGLDGKTYLDSHIDELESITDGSSGMDNVGMTPINGVMTTPQQSLEYLKERVDATAPTLNVASVIDFGAVGDGITNDSPFIQDAIDSLINGGCLLFTDGTFLIDDDILLTSNIEIKGSGNSKIIGLGDIILSGSDTLISTNLTSSISRDDVVINVVDTSEFSIGDFIEIKSSSEEIENSVNTEPGELNEILDIVSNQIFLSLPAGNNYEYDISFTNQATVKKIIPIENLSINNISIERDLKIINAINVNINCVFTNGTISVSTSRFINIFADIINSRNSTGCLIADRIRDSKIIISTYGGKDGIRIRGCCDTIISAYIVEVNERGIRFFKSYNCKVKDWSIIGSKIIVDTNSNSLMFDRSLYCTMENGYLNEPNKTGDFACVEFRFCDNSIFKNNDINNYSDRIFQYKHTTVNGIIEFNKIHIKNQTGITRAVLTGDYSIVETVPNASVSLISNNLLVEDFDATITMNRNVSNTEYTNIPFTLINISNNIVRNANNPTNYSVIFGSFFAANKGLKELVIENNRIESNPVSSQAGINLSGIYDFICFNRNFIEPSDSYTFDLSIADNLDTDLFIQNQIIATKSPFLPKQEKFVNGKKDITDKVKDNILQFDIPVTNFSAIVLIDYVAYTNGIRTFTSGQLRITIGRHSATGYNTGYSLTESISQTSVISRSGETLTTTFSLSSLTGIITEPQSFFLELLSDSSINGSGILTYSVKSLGGNANYTSETDVIITPV